MFMSDEENLGQNNIINTKLVSISSGSVTKSNIWKRNTTNHVQIHEEIQKRLYLGNDCCHLAQELLCSSLLSSNIKTEIPKRIIMPLFCNGIEVVSHIKARTRTEGYILIIVQRDATQSSLFIILQVHSGVLPACHAGGR